VFADGGALIEGLEFPNFEPANGFAEVPAGTYSVAVAPATAGVEAAAIGPANLEFAAGTQTDVIAVGRLGGTEGTIEELTVTLADDDPRQIPLFAKVRIIHASVTAASLDPDTVDIYVTAPGTDISDESVAPTRADVPYLANTGYLAVAGGTYDITVTLSGSRTPAIGPLEDVVLADGGIYTVIARDALPGDAATDLGVILIDAIAPPSGPASAGSFFTRVRTAFLRSTPACAQPAAPPGSVPGWQDPGGGQTPGGKGRG
jgi:hypothetical protein